MGEGLSRRELLKRGAIAGGALWATPIMHSVGMAQVDSEDTSPGVSAERHGRGSRMFWNPACPRLTHH